METQKMIDKFLEEIIKEFKNIKRIRGDIFSNFVSFVNLYLTGLKDDKYKDIKINITTNRSIT